MAQQRGSASPAATPTGARVRHRAVHPPAVHTTVLVRPDAVCRRASEPAPLAAPKARHRLSYDVSTRTFGSRRGDIQPADATMDQFVTRGDSFASIDECLRQKFGYSAFRSGQVCSRLFSIRLLSSSFFLFFDFVCADFVEKQR